jgi:hypothetical protein
MDMTKSKPKVMYVRVRGLSACVLLVVTLYLLFVGVSYYTMSHVGQISTTLPAVAQMNSSSTGVADLNRFMQNTIVIPVLIAFPALLIWYGSYRRLMRPVWSCPACRDLSRSIQCPECGKVTETVQGTTVTHEQIATTGETESLSSQRRSFQKGVSLFCLLLLSLSVISLALGGFYHLLQNSIIDYLCQPSGLPSSNLIAIQGAIEWDLAFKRAVLPAVLVGIVGFWAWFIPYRRLASASGLCPSCHYDLSGTPCSKCDVTGSVEKTA